jgi:1-acyl-sn-glycerol-3-phosphate acyltransferase
LGSQYFVNLMKSSDYLPNKYSVSDTYCTPDNAGVYTTFPTLYFYLKLVGIFAAANDEAVKGMLNDSAWIRASAQIFRSWEKAGGKICIDGLDNLKKNDGPVVFVGNHMSSHETLMLACVIHPVKRVLYIMKKSLLNFPLFGEVTKARDPIVVGRENPREDLQIVLNEGKKRLEKGKSIIIFPQKTRTKFFNEKEFNSLGVKLAQRNKVPIIPIAVLTDAWENGKLIKDFGKLHMDRVVRYSFGQPIEVKNPAEAHQQSIEFIKSKLIEWGREDLIVKD